MLLSKNVITPGRYVKLSRRPRVLRKTVISRKYVFYFEKTQTIHGKPMPFAAAWNAFVSNKYN